MYKYLNVLKVFMIVKRLVTKVTNFYSALSPLKYSNSQIQTLSLLYVYFLNSFTGMI